MTGTSEIGKEKMAAVTWSCRTRSSTLVKVLALDSWICQGAALHGLDHIHHPDTATVVSRSIREHPALTDEQILYARAAAEFKVL